MNVILMVFYLAVALGALVFIHEGGPFLAARAFGVRVTEFMLGLPGPSIGFTWRGTRFGVTAVPLGGYAKGCGMEAGITTEEAVETFYALEEWGCVVGPKRADAHNVFRTRAARDAASGRALAEGTPRAFDDAHELYMRERAQTYRSLPFWKRSVILLAGIAMNLLFVVVAFVAVYSVFGVDMADAQGALNHVTIPVWQAVLGSFAYMGQVVIAVAGLFNPATVSDTMSNSVSVIGMAVVSKQYADAGPLAFLFFMAMISVSLGIMNLLPIPPLDGGRFVIEVFQKITGRVVGYRAMNVMTFAGLALMLVFFVVMLNQDIHRFIFGEM